MQKFANLTSRVNSIHGILWDAQQLDRAEARLVIESTPIVNLPCTVEAAIGQASRDLQQAAARASAELSRIYATHAWFSASAQSETETQNALDTWQQAYTHSTDIESDLRTHLRSGLPWEGRAADGRAITLDEALKNQTKLNRETNRLIDGCLDAKKLTSEMFSEVEALVMRHHNAMAGRARRGAWASTSLFALNSRTKLVASELKGLADGYEAFRTSGAWIGRSNAIARVFQNNISALRGLGPYAPIPV